MMPYLTTSEHDKIVELYGRGESTCDLANKFGVDNSSVCRILKRRGIARRSLSEAARNRAWVHECVVCGNRITARGRKTCSDVCLCKTQSGENNGAWKGGSNPWTYRKIAMATKLQVCETCGTTGKLSVHHIDKNHANNTPENLKMLCQSCHIKLHLAQGDVGTTGRKCSAKEMSD